MKVRLGSRFLARATVMALGLCQAIIWLEPEDAQFSVIEHLATPLAALAVLAIVLAALGRAWIDAALAAILFLTLSWPAYPRAAAEFVEGERLRVVSANLWVRADGGAQALRLLENSDADVIGLVEVTDEWRRRLAPLIARYPHRVDCFEIDPRCETMLLSRLPVRQRFAGRINGAMPIVAGAELEWRGRRFTILVTHLIWPFPKSGPSADFSSLPGDPPHSAQAEQAARLAGFVNALSRDLVLMGDLNCVPWSRTGRAFAQATGLVNRAGSAATFPAGVPWPFALPIDHVLARGHPVVVEFRALEAFESNHRAVQADIAWHE
jgi:endonuclease/exonuclease/phosphatase (EEP) superfamily protein YafD